MIYCKYLANIAENDLKRLKDKYKIVISDLSFLKETNGTVRTENDNFEERLTTLQNANKECSHYISVLESDNKSLKAQVKRLTSILPPNRLELIEKQSPFAIINMQKQKAKFQINANYLQKQNKLRREIAVGRGTQTEICGTDQELIDNSRRMAGIEVPVCSIAIQATPDKRLRNNKEVETEMTIEDIEFIEKTV